MTTLFNKLIFILIAIFITTSCQENDVIENKIDNPILSSQELIHKTDKINIYKVIDQSLSSEIQIIFEQNQDLIAEMIGNQNIKLNSKLFDFSKIYKSEIIGVEGEALTINLKDKLSNNLSFVVFRDKDNRFFNPMVINILNENNIEYSILSETNNILITNTNKGIETKISQIFPNSNARSYNLGKNTMACMQDAYSNHGWTSVYITVQSAFIPQTVAAIAIGCAMKNSIEYKPENINSNKDKIIKGDLTLK